MCLYSFCCRRMLFCSLCTSTAVAWLSLYSSLPSSTSSSFFHNLKRHLHHPPFHPQASQGRIFTASLSIDSSHGHTEAARETAWVLLKFGMFSCAATLLYLADPAHHTQPLLSPSSMACTKLCRPQPALSSFR